MVKKILLSKEEYDSYKEHYETIYNAEYINNKLKKKMEKFEIKEELEENNKELEMEISNNKRTLLKEKASSDNFLEKEYKSDCSKMWGIFRANEYKRYKEQVPAAKRSYSDFMKKAGYVWKELSFTERKESTNNGWEGDWNLVNVK